MQTRSRRLAAWLLSALLSASTSWAGKNVWTPIGPWGGYVDSLALDPNSSTTLYAGTPKGFFKTTDGGASWTLVNGARFSFGPASFDPQNPGTIYAGPGFGTAPNGGPWLLKSTDGGANWNLSNTGLEGISINPRLLTVDPQSSNTVYVATQVNTDDTCIREQNKNCTSNQIFKSTDGAQSWNPASTGLPITDSPIVSLVIDPQDSRVLYVGVNTYTGNTSTGAIFKTTNGGANWSEINSGIVVQGLVLDPQDHNTIYAATTSGLLKSTNGGSAWSVVSSNLPRPYLYADPLVIDPQNTNVMYVATSGPCLSSNVFKSVDGGRTWTAGNLLSAFVSASMLVLDPQNSGTVYAASNGVFKSTDGGVTWNSSSFGLGGAYLRSFALDPKNSGTVYAVTDRGLEKTTDGGANWSFLNSGLPKQLAGSINGCGPVALSSLVIDAQNPSTLYAGVNGNLGFYYSAGQVLKSTDAGASWAPVGEPSWTALNDTLPQGAYFSFTGNLLMDPQNSRSLYAALWVNHVSGCCSAPFAKSMDGGDNWALAGSIQTGYSFSALAFDPENPSTLYAAAGGVLKSTDGGADWSAPSQLPVPAEGEPADCDEFWTPVTALGVDPQNSNNVYATGSGGVFKSTDSGASFQTLDSNVKPYICDRTPNCFDPYTALSVAIDPQNSNNVYVVLGGGVLRSADGGSTWTQLNSGLPASSPWNPSTLSPWTLAIDPNDSRTLYLATSNDGIYTITLVL